ncbi:hypothetical protein A5865_001167, partial [Enterococcus sp. 12E11_DIV0728]
FSDCGTFKTVFLAQKAILK